MIIKVKKLVHDARLPVYATSGAAGCDVFSIEDISIPANDWRVIRTGLSLEIPPGFECQVRSRSGNAVKYGVTVLNSPGTIDNDYRGEIKVILMNGGKGWFEVEKGDKIAQLVLAPVKQAIFLEDDALSETERGQGGFGSTGK